MNYKPYKHLPPFKGMVLQNFPFIEEDFDAITNYQLLCKVVEYLKNVIANELIMEENVTNLYNSFTELKNYVDNYFANLDVQEEINNKLDEMVSDGTLQEIISDYLNANALWTFDNVNQMKSATNLINGSFAKTLGYYQVNDGGGGTYQIVNEDLTDDGGSVHELDNGLFAKLIIENDTINVRQFGAKGDGITDDTISIQNAINKFNNISGNIDDLYYITEQISVSNKTLNNMKIKVEPYEVETGNTFRTCLLLSNNNNLYNISVSSEFEYIPSIEIFADPTSIKGLASNVKAFQIINGITNFYNCRAVSCWAFSLSGSARANIYNFIGTSLEMSYFSSSSGECKIYNSKFNIDKTVDSIYYHHVYVKENTITTFDNCVFTESNTGDIGNHYHCYSTTIDENYSVSSSRLTFNNCELRTDVIAGQSNCCNLYVNGGVIQAKSLLSNGSYINKPSNSFKNVRILLADITTVMTIAPVNIDNCIIRTNTTGDFRISNKQPFNITNTKFYIPNGTYNANIGGSETELQTVEERLINCEFYVNTISWVYPYYATNFYFYGNIYNLTTEKSTINPINRNSVGYMLNCIFNNWGNPFIADTLNTFKFNVIANDNVISNLN